MNKIKSVLLMEVPVVALIIGAAFGLSSDEQDNLAKLLTTLVATAFGLVAIYQHRKLKKKVK